MILYCGYSWPCGYSDDVVGSWCIEKYCRTCSIWQMIWWSIDKHVFRWIKNTHQFWHAWTHNGCLFFDLKPLVITIFVHTQYVFLDDTCAQLSRSFLCMTTCCIHVIYIMLLFLRTCIIVYIVTHTYTYIYILLYYIYARGFSGTPWPLYHGSGEAWVSVANSSKPSRIFSNWSFSFLPFSRVGMILWYPLLSHMGMISIDILWF